MSLWPLISDFRLLTSTHRLCPIFQISNVTGQGLDFVRSIKVYMQCDLNNTPLQVRTFLNLLPSSEADTDKFALNQPLEVGGILSSLNACTYLIGSILLLKFGLFRMLARWLMES